MQPSELNLILLTVISLTVIAIAAAMSHAVRNQGRPIRVSIRILAAVLIFAAFLPMTRTLWWQLSGALPPKIVWWQSPSFYITVVAMIVGGLLWIKSQPSAGTKLRLLNFIILPAMVLAIVGGSERLFSGIRRAQSAALNASLVAVSGRTAPDFGFVDSEGQHHTLSEYKGKVVLLNFWSLSCGPCIAEMPDLSSLQQQFAPRGFVLVLLSADEAPALARFFASHPTVCVRGQLTSTERAPDFYHAYEAWPISFLIDREGVVIDNWLGAAPTDWMQHLIEGRL